MNRRHLLTILALAPLTRALAQQKAAKIGVLGPSKVEHSVYSPGVVRRLAELGYKDIEYRSTDGVPELYTKYARELVALKCSLAIAIGVESAARALQDTRTPMPIVFLAVDYDPVEKGIVANLRKPDRNTTGVYVPQNELVAKRMELMRDTLPSARRMMVLTDLFSRDQVAPTRKAAEAMRFQVTLFDFPRKPYGYAAAFEAARKAETETLMTLSSPVFSLERAAIAELAAKHRIPAIGSSLRQADAGFLFALGANIGKVTGRTAEIAARILRGAKPEDIPVEQGDEFELAVNSKTAAALGVKVPERVLARATRIVT